MISKFFDWLDRLIMKIMSKRGPRKTNAKETEEVLKRKDEYEKWAKEGK